MAYSHVKALDKNDLVLLQLILNDDTILID